MKQKPEAHHLASTLLEFAPGEDSGAGRGLRVTMVAGKARKQAGQLPKERTSPLHSFLNPSVDGGHGTVANSDSNPRVRVRGLRRGLQRMVCPHPTPRLLYHDYSQAAARSERSHLFAPNNGNHLGLTAHDGKLFT